MSTAIGNAFGKKRIDYLKKPFDLFEPTEAEKAMKIRQDRQRVIEYLNGLAAHSKAKESDMGVDQNGSKS